MNNYSEVALSVIGMMENDMMASAPHWQAHIIEVAVCVQERTGSSGKEGVPGSSNGDEGSISRVDTAGGRAQGVCLQRALTREQIAQVEALKDCVEV